MQNNKMKITPITVSVRQLVDGFQDNGDKGVVAFGGKLNVRPAYQREFVYKPADEAAVINTALKCHPLGQMFWADDGNGGYELVDGQQRTMSLCRFASPDPKFGVDWEGRRVWGDSLGDYEKPFYDQHLSVFLCEGSQDEKMEWFETLNISGKSLTAQELRNAVYCSEWVGDAKRYFSRRNQGAHGLGAPYVSGVVERQDFLETGIKWMLLAEGKKPTKENICDFMARNSSNKSALPMWEHFQDVVHWVKGVFGGDTCKSRKLDAVEWGQLYAEHHKAVTVENTKLVSDIRSQVDRLFKDDLVTKPSGIYAYVLSGAYDGTYQRKHLHLRAFKDAEKRAAYERQGGLCAGVDCQIPDRKVAYEDCEADHHKAWSKGGPTTGDNCVILCKECNGIKSDK